MTEPLNPRLEIDDDDELEPEFDDHEAERAPQPGNTPEPDDPPYDSGAITSQRRVLDRD